MYFSFHNLNYLINLYRFGLHCVGLLVRLLFLLFLSDFIGLHQVKRLLVEARLPGAAFATIGWILTSWAFSFYVSNFENYSATYGSIGAIIVLMVWFYISGIIIMISGEVNAFYSKKEKDC